MANFRLLLEYNGSGFEGWQLQRRGCRTVQGCLTQALERIRDELTAGPEVQEFAGFIAASERGIVK